MYQLSLSLSVCVCALFVRVCVHVGIRVEKHNFIGIDSIRQSAISESQSVRIIYHHETLRMSPKSFNKAHTKRKTAERSTIQHTLTPRGTHTNINPILENL